MVLAKFSNKLIYHKNKKINFCDFSIFRADSFECVFLIQYTNILYETDRVPFGMESRRRDAKHTVVNTTLVTAVERLSDHRAGGDHGQDSRYKWRARLATDGQLH